MRYTLPRPSTRWMIRETAAPSTYPSRRHGRHRPDPSSVPDPSSLPDPSSVPDPTPASAPAPAPEAEAVPDPFEDADALEDLGDEIVTLAAHIHAATHRLLLLIADFDRREGWKLGGHESCAHWLSVRTGMRLGGAREKVRTARALVGLPLIGASMAQGKLSFSKVRALSRVATPDNEGDLLACAEGATTAQLERMVRGYRLGSRRDEVELEEERHRNRSFTVFPDVDGMYVVRGRLTPELGALLMRAVEAASDALYREGRRTRAGSDEEEAWDRILEAMDGGDGGEGGTGSSSSSRGARDTAREAAQRRADALGLLAERALGAGFGTGSGGDEGDEGGEGAQAPVSGSRAERYQVVVHVDAETLAEEDEAAAGDRGSRECGCGGSGSGCGGRSELDDGTRVSAETSRRLSCDAGRVEIRHGPGGSILDVGRRTRTVPPALRRALEARDQGCRFPGCGLRFAEGHHVTHWADGGETKLDNLVLLCRHHHRLLHEGGWTMQWWGEGRPAFFDPRGGIHFDGRWEWPGAGDGPGRGDGQRQGDGPGRGNGQRRGDGPGRGDGLGGQEGETAVSAPPAEADSSLVEDLIADHEARGIRPHGRTPSARWQEERHIPDSIYFNALEAMGEGRG